jgi:hypothetical protein
MGASARLAARLALRVRFGTAGCRPEPWGRFWPTWLPGAPLIPILFLSQALNALLLLAILPFLRALARDGEPMGTHRLGRLDSLLTAVVIALVGVWSARSVFRASH